uniref:Hexosyltransferase n=1 Tax=Plectus sambesii TaxID=2011161 RepID=A0A914V7S2_9BILA
MSTSLQPRLLPRLTFVLLALIFAGVLLLGRSVRRDRPIQSTSRSLSLLISPTPTTASGNHPLLVVVVLSHVVNRHRRTAIRQSWARHAQNSNCSLLFVVGTTADANVSGESQLHGDIIQVNVQENYHRLAYKLKPAFAYVLEHVNFDYLLKTDDDVFVNLPLLISQLLLNDDSKKATNTMLGYQILGATAPTNQSDKYFALQLMAQLIPPYLSGTGYVMSRQVLRNVIECPLGPMPYEDVYFTGICREHFNITLEHSELFGYSRRQFVPCALRRSVIAHGLSAEQMTSAYTMTLSSNWRC